MSTPQAPPVSTRFNPDTLARLDELAASRQCTRSDVIKEAVDGYLDVQTWLESKVGQSWADIKEGRVVSLDEVKGSIKALGYHVD